MSTQYLPAGMMRKHTGGQGHIRDQLGGELGVSGVINRVAIQPREEKAI